MTPPEEPLLKPCKYGMSHLDVCGCREYYRHEAESFKNLAAEKEADLKKMEASRDAHIILKNDSIAEAHRVIEEKEAEQKAYIEQVEDYHKKLLQQAETLKTINRILQPKLYYSQEEELDDRRAAFNLAGGEDAWHRHIQERLEYQDKMKGQADVILIAREALGSISKNTCCGKCKESALWAKEALEKMNRVEGR